MYVEPIGLAGKVLWQQNGVVTPHLGYPSIDPALGGYPTKKYLKNFIIFG